LQSRGPTQSVLPSTRVREPAMCGLANSRIDRYDP
jgi:hypothetical protein